ncbi:hypothetical protein GTQ40_04730 [Flavobacteriaceae bacterium R38]|nr:hypothetical protein [Flavobacteriaceae bacterium R38]
MLKDILKLKGVTELEKKQQKNLQGGIWGGFECPTFCQSAEDCLSGNGDCAFTQAICATGTCLFFH